MSQGTCPQRDSLTRADHHQEERFFHRSSRQTAAFYQARPGRTCALLIIASLVGLFLLAGCGGGESPPMDAIYPMVKKCAQGPHFYLTRELSGMVSGTLSPVIPPGWEKVKNKEVTVVGIPAVGTPIIGYFGKKDETYTIWPIEMQVEITIRKTELPMPMGPSTSEILKNPAIVNEKSYKPPAVPAVKEKVKEVSVVCYAFKDKYGNWKVYSEMPIDVTTFYQRWWLTLRQKWRF